MQVPELLHTSRVHASPSSAHAALLWNCSVQVAVPLQVRVTQALLLQTIDVPRHTPALQRSVCVQRSPSSQVTAFGVLTHALLTH